jgi:hypothetical protein
MIGVTINTEGVNVVIRRLRSLDALRDPARVRPMLDEMLATIYEDNRRGVMLGLDKDGKPAPPLKYRGAARIQSSPRTRSTGTFGQSTRVGSTTGEVLIRGRAPGRLNPLGKALERHNANPANATKQGKRTLHYAVLPNNNLRTDQYRKLTGPRLAPRRDQSRAIANLVFREPRLFGWGWRLEAYWKDVLTPKGRKLLPPHFEGRIKKTPAYDLRGVRPWGMERMRHIARAFVLGLLKAGA